MTEYTLERLIDRQRIIDRLSYQLACGVDFTDWKLYRSIFADEIYVNFYDPALPHVPPPKVWNTDEWIRFASSVMGGFESTHHNLTNYIFDFKDDDNVTVKSYVISEHHLNGDFNTVGGQYTFEFRRIDGEWMIVGYGLLPVWSRGNTGLFQDAQARYERGEGRNTAAQAA